MGLSAATVQTITAIAAAASAGTAIYAATQTGGRAQGQPQPEKSPNANVYKDRNAQNALVQGNSSTGTGALLTSSGNVASNTLLGQ